MNEIQIFSNPEFGEIRTLETSDGKFMVCGADVAKALGYADTAKAVKAHCKEDGWAFCPVIDSMGRVQNIRFISEGNLYRLIVHSKLPDAERFERWVFDEVIPSIRRNEIYTIKNFLDNDKISSDLLMQIALQMKADETKIKALEQKIEENKEKVAFADAVADSENAILIGELAKILMQNGVNTGQNRLFIWMRNHGYLIGRKGSDYNAPTQTAMEMKLFRLKKTTVIHSDGHTSISNTPKVTGKGQIYFINLFLSELKKEDEIKQQENQKADT